MDMYNLKELVTRLIAGSSIEINPDKFQNDMTTFASADDVLTLLVHLGYLTYDFDTCTVHIPNQEVQKEFINCCLLYTSPSPRDTERSRMPSSA